MPQMTKCWPLGLTLSARPTEASLGRPHSCGCSGRWPLVSAPTAFPQRLKQSFLPPLCVTTATMKFKSGPYNWQSLDPWLKAILIKLAFATSWGSFCHLPKFIRYVNSKTQKGDSDAGHPHHKCVLQEAAQQTASSNSHPCSSITPENKRKFSFNTT